MKKILFLLNTDRFSFPLIRYLILEGRRYGWITYVGSMFDDGILERIKKEKFSSDIGFVSITDLRQCDFAIRKSDLVIAMVPEVMLLQIADSCIQHGRTMITPNRLSQRMMLKKTLAEENNTLLLFECGFSPGLDHITAKKAIDNIHVKGGQILEFRTYSGSLLAEHCVNNPWKFKLTEPAAAMINFGRYNNRHLIHGKVRHIPCHHLFARGETIEVTGIKDVISIPEGDSLYYRKIYELNEANTVIRGKLFKKGFESIWNLVVKLGLTDNLSSVNLLENRSLYHFLDSFLPYSPSKSLEHRLKEYIGASAEDIEKLKWLGFFDDKWVFGKDLSPADILQALMEKKLALKHDDEDCIVMLHHIVYLHKNILYDLKATFTGKGENQWDSAIAKATGLASGAAAKSFLLGNFKSRGIHIPTQKEFYEPILQELDDLGVAFRIEKNIKCIAINELVNMAMKDSEKN